MCIRDSPCGIQDKAVTSLNKELGHDVNMNDIKGKLKKHFSSLFECEIINQQLV